MLAALYDVADYRIPNVISIALAALYPLFVLFGTVQPAWGTALIIAAAVFAAGLGLFAAGLMGGGDVKLMTVVALWAGPVHIVGFLMVTALAGGLLALIIISPLRSLLAHTVASMGGSAINQTLSGAVLPYGVAIAAGGAYVGVMLISGAG